MDNSTTQLAQNKLIILFLIEKMSIPISNSEICQFALEKNYMDYFSAQQYLSELAESGFLEFTSENNTTRYTITDEGSEVLGFFVSHIPDTAKSDIAEYIHQNSKRIKTEYEITANYFHETDGSFLVKCGVYDSDGSRLMEISLIVPNKDQAKQVCANWKTNATSLYFSIFSSLASAENENKNPAAAEEKEVK